MGDRARRTIKRRRLQAGAVSFLLLLCACAGAVGRRTNLSLQPGQGGTPGADQPGGVGQTSGTSSTTGPLQPGTSVEGGSPSGPAGSTPREGPYQGEIGVTKDQVFIGLFRGKSGSAAAIQTNGDQGMQAAFNEVNDAGGIHGRKIFVKSYDDGSLNPSVIDANWRVAKDQVLAPFAQEGTYFIPHSERDRVPMLYGGALMEMGLSSRYGFTIYPFVEYQSRDLMPNYMIKRLQGLGKRIAVIYDSRPADLAARKAFRDEADALGLNIVFEQPVPDVPPTCANEVSNVADKDPDIVFLLANIPAAICVFRDARTLGFRPTWTGVAYTFALDVVIVASGGATEGTVAFGGNRTIETSCGDRFRNAVQKYYPERRDMATDAYAYIVYLIGRRFIEYLRRVGPNPTRAALLRTIEESSGLDDGCFSPPTFGPGDRRGPLGVSLTQSQGQRWVTIDPVWRKSF